MGTKQFLEESRIRICDAVRAAAHGTPRVKQDIREDGDVQPKLTADAVMAEPRTSRAMIQTTEKVVVVGASTGGTEALRVFLEALPPDAPGIVIVQHMPEHFTAAFAKGWTASAGFRSRRRPNDDTVIRGRALIAPATAICS